MAIKEFWPNSGIRLFRVDKNGVVSWLGNSSIDKVWWYEDKQGRMRIQGPLGIAEQLNRLESGDTIEVIHKEYGRWEEYDPDAIIARLTNCQIKRRWMINLAPQHPEDVNSVILYVSILCDVDLLV